MSKKIVFLEDIAETCLGKMLDKNKNQGILQPYLANINVRWGDFDLDNLPEMKFKPSEQERYGIHYGDLIVCEGGEPGRCAIWKDAIPGMKIQKALHRVRVNREKADYRWLYYWFLLAGKCHALDQYYTGATIKHMPGDKLKKIKIPLPPLAEQRRIADILSAYDDLIENNRKQIKLLEEAAQRLYKEWFIDFHFPGYEHTKIINGLPEGWKKEFLTDIADIQYGYAFDGSLFNDKAKGTPIIRIRNIPIGVTNDYTTEEANNQYLVNNGEIVVGMDGEFHINTWGGETAYLVQRTCCLRPKKEIQKGYLLLAIHDPIKFFEKTVVGSTVAHLGKKHLDTIMILIPPDKFIIMFHSFFEKRQLLLNKITKLISARDHLLPKLMNGKIEVREK